MYLVYPLSPNKNLEGASIVLNVDGYIVCVVVHVCPTVGVVNDLNAINLFGVEVFVTTLDASVISTLDFSFKWIPHFRSLS